MIIASCDPSLLTPHLPPSRSTFAWGVNSESGAFARGREGAIERYARIVRSVCQLSGACSIRTASASAFASP